MSVHKYTLHSLCPDYLTILRPERRTFSTTWLKQSSLPQNVPLRTTFSRLSTTVNVRQLLQIRQNRESSSFVLPPKPRYFHSCFFAFVFTCNNTPLCLSLSMLYTFIIACTEHKYNSHRNLCQSAFCFSL